MSVVPLVPEVNESLPRIGEAEGLLSWVASIDHKQIALMYLMATFFFFVVGGLEALLMRIQLAAPRMHFLPPDAYNQMFTMHGTTMIFLVIMPMLIGFATYLVPLMIGARDMAFPRLNALSFWLLIFGGLMLYFSFIAGGTPDDGWFAYAPLTERQYSPNPGMDYWCVGLLTTGIGTVASGVNLLVTILTMRAPGMTLRRMPLLVWAVLINSFLIIWALPALNAALVMLFIDRQLTAHFFDAINGGAPLLWQHVFWSFGHPEVYIMVLPAFGIISEVIAVFSRKATFGYAFMVGSLAAITVLSFAVYGHHMFVAGMSLPLDIAFGASSMLIAVPTGIKIFNWLSTAWGGSIRFTTAMLFALGFIPTFTMGGLTGVSFAVFPIDWQMEDSYYVVAHLHYVLMGGTALAMFAGIYYWFPKMTGRMLFEWLGVPHFWLTFIGFHLTFLPQHVLGIWGMSRRIFTYPDLPGWGLLNLISTIGSFILAAGVLVFIVNVVLSLRFGKRAGDNPWNAWTLEWATASPPAPHNFEAVPPVRSRRPLWDLAHPDQADWRQPAAQHGPEKV